MCCLVFVSIFVVMVFIFDLACSIRFSGSVVDWVVFIFDVRRKVSFVFERVGKSVFVER